MKKWMQYMRTKYMKDYILTKDKYGDWCVPPEDLHIIRSRDSTRTTDGELIATATYYHLLGIMKKFASLTWRDADEKAFDELRKNIRLAFNRKFYNKEKKCYDNNTVTANLLPLYFGIAEYDQRQAVFRSIYEKIKDQDNMHISTGVIGTQWLMRGLTKYGHPEAAYLLASNKTYPSWGYMVEQGATTIWELWNGNTADPQMNSQNHVMLLGDLMIWLYEDVAGIKSDDDKGAAFQHVIMNPRVTNELDWVKAAYQSLYGEIKSEWHKTAEAFEWNVTIPPNTSAELHIPSLSLNDVAESGKQLNKSDDVRMVKWETGTAVMIIGSGQYKFVSKTK